MAVSSQWRIIRSYHGLLRQRPLLFRRHLSSSSGDTVPLVFELMKPARGSKEGYDSRNSAILFLHGLFGSKRNNREVGRAMADELGRHIYLLDLRNHGESPHHPRHDYPIMASDVEEFISHHRLAAPTLVGHSMGAKAAMTVALRSPELVRDVVVIDNAPVAFPPDTTFESRIQGMVEIERRRVATRQEADKILQGYEKSELVRRFLLTNMARPENEQHFVSRVPLQTLSRSLGHVADFPYEAEDAVQFDKPALFVRGTQSAYVPDKYLPVIKQLFPRFQLADIPSGHWVTHEKPQEFKDAVVKFLSSHA